MVVSGQPPKIMADVTPRSQLVWSRWQREILVPCVTDYFAIGTCLLFFTR